MERVAIDLGIIQIYWYSIFIFLGILVACILIYKESERQNIDKDFVINLAFTTIVVGIIGARLYYVLFNLDYYKNNLLEILEIWNGGLAIHGGILFGFLALFISCKKNSIPVLKMLDIAVVGLIIGQAIGRWGNFFNGEAYGAVTTLEHLKSLHIPEFVINGMYILGDYRQPTFLYESIFNLIGFIILIIFRRGKYVKIGQITGLYFIWYSLVRFIIEGQRSDSLMLGTIKVARLVSVILLLVGIVLFIYYKILKKEAKFDHLYNEEKSSNEFINQQLGGEQEEKRQLFIR